MKDIYNRDITITVQENMTMYTVSDPVDDSLFTVTFPSSTIIERVLYSINSLAPSRLVE